MTSSSRKRHPSEPHQIIPLIKREKYNCDDYDPDPVLAIILNTETEMHNCLAHIVQGEGAHPPPAQGATAAQSATNVRAWIAQVVQHALGANAILHLHSGRRGTNPLLLERLDHSQVNLVCIEFGNYAQWTANLTTANQLLSLGTIVEGINIAGRIVFSQNLAGPFLG